MRLETGDKRRLKKLLLEILLTILTATEVTVWLTESN